MPGFVGVDANIGIFDIAVGGFDVLSKEGLNLLALAVRLEGVAIGPDFVENNRVAFSLGKGILDLARDGVEQAGIFPMGIGLQRLQGLEHRVFLAGLGLEAGRAVNLL